MVGINQVIRNRCGMYWVQGSGGGVIVGGGIGGNKTQGNGGV